MGIIQTRESKESENERWFRENSHLIKWDKLTFTQAAREGHLEVPHWAKDHECPWNEWTRVEAALGEHYSSDKSFCANAVREGHYLWNEQNA